MTLHLELSPCPIEALAEQIATTIFTTTWDATERAALKRQLVEFAAEIKRTAAEVSAA